jgi:REP element-mobilizing transposase RayT
VTRIKRLALISLEGQVQGKSRERCFLEREKGTGYFFIVRPTARVVEALSKDEKLVPIVQAVQPLRSVQIVGSIGCLMPNHFHLVVEPAHQTALSQFMQWLLTSHVRRYHKHYGSSGHVWQGRFKSFAVQRDEHLITNLRYVLQNPVRAGLSETVHEWPWSSARRRQLVDRSPVDEEIRWSEQLESRL